MLLLEKRVIIFNKYYELQIEFNRLKLEPWLAWRGCSNIAFGSTQQSLLFWHRNSIHADYVWFNKINCWLEAIFDDEIDQLNACQEAKAQE